MGNSPTPARRHPHAQLTHLDVERIFLECGYRGISILIEDAVTSAYLNFVIGIFQGLFPKRLHPDEDFHFEARLTISASLHANQEGASDDCAVDAGYADRRRAAPLFQRLSPTLTDIFIQGTGTVSVAELFFDVDAMTEV
jgi:hypothetical protein